MAVIKQVSNFLFSIWHKKDQEGDLSFFLAAGPLSVFSSAIVGLEKSYNLDLVFVAMLGMVLSIRNRMAGFFYSLIILFIDSVIKHAFFVDSHLWQIGIEISIAIGFGLIAFAVDMILQKESSLIDQTRRQKSTIDNLEEDVAKVRQDSQTELIAINDRFSLIQKELDDVSIELSSLQILNDVLRKTTAETNQEKEKIIEKYIEKDRLVGRLQGEVERFTNESNLFRDTIAEREFDLNRLQEELHELSSKLTEISSNLEKSENEKALAIQSKDQAEAKLLQVQTKLTEQIASFNQEEKDRFQRELSEQDQEMAIIRERLQEAHQKETLFFQLKKQFDEKNHILHQTRRELFHLDISMQAIKLDQERADQLPPSLEEEKLVSDLIVLEKEMISIKEENEELLQLIHRIMKEKAEKKPKEILERLSKVKSKSAKVSEKKKNKKEFITEVVQF